MAKYTRIYTRTGDDGTTGLVGGQRVRKSSPRLDAYGTVDELSSTIGVARAALRSSIASLPRAATLDAWLAWTQDALFNLGSNLATLPADRGETMPRIDSTHVRALETAIDSATRDLPPLDRFIHPGGSLPGAHLHVARTVCRRAERLVSAMREGGDAVDDDDVRYLNRLSDALFVWARWINHGLDIPEHVWNPSSAPPQAPAEG